VLEALRAGGLHGVHEHTLTGPLNAAVYAAAGLPTVHTVHGPVDEDMYPYYHALAPDLHLVAISNQQRRRAPGLNWVATVHNGLDVRAWPFRERKQDFALFLGRFHPQKAPHLALEAAHEAGIPLVLAGKCSEALEKAYFD